MADLKFKPVRHQHDRFDGQGQAASGVRRAYESLGWSTLANQMLKARAKAGLTQDAVAERMGTTKERHLSPGGGGRHAPSLATLKKYAAAVGVICR